MKTKAPVQNHEWDFWPIHAASPAVLRFVWTYELDRELGSGKAAFLSLPANARKLAAEKINAKANEGRQPVRELSFSENVHRLGADAGNWNHLLTGDGTAHLLAIDWHRYSKREILDAVARWIESKPNYILAEGRGLPDKDGRPEGWFAKLVDLAVWRLSAAGITHSDGVKKLGKSFPTPPPKGFSNPATMSAPHWSDAKRRTRAAIQQRLHDLQGMAANLARLAGESADFRDHFSDLP